MHQGGQAVIEACSAAIDGGALYALAPVQFSPGFPIDAVTVKVNERGTTLVGNIAGARGGGIATWAPINIGFGYPLVCTFWSCSDVF